MLKCILICIIILSAIGCGKISEVESDLKPFFDSFQSTFGVSAEYISGKFANLDNPLIGVCVGFEIKIDQYAWRHLSWNGKEQLVYHELGHCVMNLQHVKEVLGNGCPVSIMYPFGFGEGVCYTHNRLYYISELNDLKPVGLNAP